MIVAIVGRIGDDRTAYMPVSPAALAFIQRCLDDDTSVVAQPDHLAAS